MGIGRMNQFIDIVQKTVTKDEEGFGTVENTVLYSCRAYREGRHGSEMWTNMATYSSATDLFRFRVIPGLEVTTDMRILCGGHEFEITSVEDVRGKGMYIECLVQEVTAGGDS